MDKRTKIIATISDKRCEVEFIRSLYEAGMNAVRINTAHVTTRSAATIVENVAASPRRSLSSSTPKDPKSA